jgi:putative flippase GtrA
VIASGVKPFAANVVASAAGLTFVYFASVRRVFRYEGQFLTAMFATYAVYHLWGTLLVAWGVSELIAFGWHPAGAKILILPMTFAANYLFMSWLTSQPLRWVHKTRC